MSQPTRRGVLAATVVAGLGAATLGPLRELAAGATSYVPTTASRAALAASTACATLTQELTQGPFWVDERLQRADIRADSETGAVQAGVPLTLTIKLTDATGDCTPQVGAYVDIWHANAQGAYSDVSGSGNPDNRGLDWLRGYQVSDDEGKVTFTTIWPGWYVSRTVHVHFRVRLALDDSTTVNFASQLFFDDTANDTVLATSTYSKSRSRDTTNASDGIFDSSLVVPVTGSTSAGYSGTFTVNLDFGDGADEGSGDCGSDDADSLVDAWVPLVTAVRRSRTRRRWLRVVISRRERVASRIRLVRGDDVLVDRRTGWLPRGRSAVWVRVPGSVTAGRARVVVKLVDAAGNTKISRSPVRVPAR